MKQLGKRNILFCFTGCVHFAKACASHYHIAKHHFGVFDKIAVHRNAVLVGVKVYPVWLYIHYTVTLLQNQNIACNLRACVCSEGVVGQTDCS